MVVSSLIINLLSFTCFYLDLFLAVFNDGWVAHTLLLFFIIIRGYEVDDVVSQHPLWIAGALLVMQDWFLMGWTGISLFYLIFLYYLTERAYFILRLNRVMIHALLFGCAIIMRGGLVIGLDYFGVDSILKTFCQICTTLGMGYILFWNVLGNRLFRVVKR